MHDLTYDEAFHRDLKRAAREGQWSWEPLSREDIVARRLLESVSEEEPDDEEQYG